MHADVSTRDRLGRQCLSIHQSEVLVTAGITGQTLGGLPSGMQEMLEQVVSLPDLSPSQSTSLSPLDTSVPVLEGPERQSIPLSMFPVTISHRLEK